MGFHFEHPVGEWQTVTIASAAAIIAVASPSRIGTIGMSTIAAPMIARR